MPFDKSDAERIRALIEEVDRVCAEARVQTQRLISTMNRAAVWPERRQPRRWDPREYSRSEED